MLIIFLLLIILWRFSSEHKKPGTINTEFCVLGFPQELGNKIQLHFGLHMLFCYPMLHL